MPFLSFAFLSCSFDVVAILLLWRFCISSFIFFHTISLIFFFVNVLDTVFLTQRLVSELFTLKNLYILFIHSIRDPPYTGSICFQDFDVKLN